MASRFYQPGGQRASGAGPGPSEVPANAYVLAVASGHAAGNRVADGVTAREETAAAIRGLGLVWRSSPLLSATLAGLTLVQGVAPALVVAQTGRFLRALPEAVELGASSAPGQTVRRALVLIALAVFVTQVVGPVSQAVLFGLQRRFEAYLARRLMAATVALPGLAWFEDPSFRDQLQVAGWIGFGPVHTLQAMVGVFQQFALVAAMAAVAATFALWVPVVVLVACLPAAVANWRFQAVVGLARWRGSPDARRADYYRDLAVDRESGKELRVFGLGRWAVGRQRRHWLEGVREMWASRRRTMAILVALNVAALAAMSFAYATMLGAAIDGRTDVGTFTAAATATTALVAAVMATAQSVGQARRNSFYLPSAVRILDLARTEPRLEVRPAAQPVAEPPERGIRFEGVSFRYPGTDRVVLDGLDLWVPAGSSLALVGENGTGKTTLIKLLARFYDPTEGRITLDGTDVRDLDLAALRDRLAVIFQDFVRYELPVRDNIGFGAAGTAAATDPHLLDAAARAVGVDRLIASLPDGWATVLARDLGGVDLSGGEWQRVALARAVMARIGRGADLLVLDEPTASLDVRVEHDLYNRFAELSRGATTLLVSHRFSTVRMAERIVLLGGGRVVEDGSHEELVAAGGRYATLYGLQSSHYNMTGALE
ncbi:MAG: ABC transporter ATP-binding protein [Actinomycetota bacterium]|jgi:ATP-binding cassette, subfamily B, bacterial